MAARMASVVDGVGDGGGMMRRWCGCGDEVRGGCDDGDDDESGGVMVASMGRQSEERGGAWREKSHYSENLEKKV
ncbi:hypothetical protein Tco_0909512 [Tanacetum coccineum]|uniref:Uncharacterized protein n=1 Tax=Tanacetum coccineum TaxID=301880 RepID=A0ABQ5CSZ9_9ASTR